MSNLAIIGSHTVNGVAELHSNLLKSTLFRDFALLFPDKFTNITNGVTPRRWLLNANPGLADLITSKIGRGWIKNLYELKKLGAHFISRLHLILCLTPFFSFSPVIESFVDDVDFQQRWREAKFNNKEKLATFLKSAFHITIHPNSLMDVQVKRIHEYKRQLLNILFCIDRYNKIKANPTADFVPRTVIFGGKAAPGYQMAKLIIRLINDVAEIINNDPAVDDKLRMVFVENFGVSMGEKIYPSADISEQISTAGLEASGTGNMKFCMNGALIVGTMDGANIEIFEEVGQDNIFIFGLTTDQIASLKPTYNPQDYIEKNADLARIMEQIRGGFFCPDEPARYKWIHDSLAFHDGYFLMADFESFIQAQERVDQAYQDETKWTQMSIRNVAKMGKFSSDRSISEYANNIWDLTPLDNELLSHMSHPHLQRSSPGPTSTN